MGQRRITQHKRFALYGTHPPNLCFASFCLTGLGLRPKLAGIVKFDGGKNVS